MGGGLALLGSGEPPVALLDGEAHRAGGMTQTSSPKRMKQISAKAVSSLMARLPPSSERGGYGFSSL